MLWGGRRLPGFLRRPAPHLDPVGEAWVLSDVDGSREPGRRRPARRADAAGPAGGRSGPRVLGGRGRAERPVPSAAEVHRRPPGAVRPGPPERRAGGAARPGQQRQDGSVGGARRRPAHEPHLRRVPPRAWTPTTFRRRWPRRDHAGTLHAFTPAPGDCVFLPAGTVHAIGADMLLFEVQQTSDITYRLYDWDRVDAKTGRPRQLHVDEGLACCGLRRGAVPPGPADCGRAARERWWRAPTSPSTGTRPRRRSGRGGRPVPRGRVRGRPRRAGRPGPVPFAVGDVFLLPAEAGGVRGAPAGGAVTVLECGLPA